MVGRLAAHLFRGHVPDGAEHGSRHGVWHRRREHRAGRDRLLLDELREAEIQNLRPAFSRDEDVGRLEIAVHDPFVVGGRQTARDLDADIDRLAGRQRSVLQPARQRLTFEQLRDDVGRVLMRPDVVDRQQIGAVQRGCRPRLELESPQPVRVAGERRRQHLDGHVAPEPVVSGPVDLAHAAGPERGHDFVRPEMIACRQGHDRDLTSAR